MSEGESEGGREGGRERERERKGGREGGKDETNEEMVEGGITEKRKGRKKEGEKERNQHLKDVFLLIDWLQFASEAMVVSVHWMLRLVSLSEHLHSYLNVS